MAFRFTRRLASGYRASASIEPGLRPGNTGGPVYGKKLPGTSQGYGGMIVPPAGKGMVKAATTSVRYVSPGQPMYSEWDGLDATEKGYLGHGYVMRCVRLRAETIGGLPFVAGPDPTDPTITDPNAQLCRFLGPASPQAPGGPNPQIDSRNMWIWTLIQHIVTGRFAWETVRGGDSASAPILELWPLVSGLLQPIPAPFGGNRYFQSYVYQTPLGDRPLKDYQCLYHWRMSARDPYQAESVLQAAMMPAQIAIGSDKYMWGLLSQGMVAPKMVITPDFEEDAARRAWEDQFTSNYTGFDNAGKVLFGYIDSDSDPGSSTGSPADRANVQVIDLAMKSVDAQLLEMVKQSKIDLEVALGVPESLLGNASQRVFCADTETEILTRQGWCRHDHISTGTEVLTLNRRSGLAEWQPCVAVNRFEVMDEPMLHMTGRTHDSLTTDGHRWPTLDGTDGMKPRWRLSEQLSENDRIITAAQVRDLPTEPKYTDDFVELVAWHWTEGHLPRSKLTGELKATVICQSATANPRYVERIRALLYRLFGEPRPTLRGRGGLVNVATWREFGTTSHGMVNWRLTRPISEQLHAVAPERCPTTEFIMSLTHSQLELFIDVSLMADGTRTNQGSRVITQAKSERLDGMELAVVLSGRTPYRFQAKGGRQAYNLVVSDRTVAGVPRLTPVRGDDNFAHREWVTYTGTVWCPSTQNMTWMARRSGKVFFTGNSNADSEYRNYWTTTAINDVAELQDAVNLRLAPQLDPRLAGWFDLSSVVALQPQSVFAPPDVSDMIDEGVVTTQDVQKILNLTALEEPAEDVETAPMGQEAVQSGAVGGRSTGFRRATRRGVRQSEGYRQVYHGMRLGENMFVRRLPLTTYTLGVAGRPGSGIWRVDKRRERAKLALPSGTRAETPALAHEVTAKVAQVRRKRAEGLRSAKGPKAAGIALKAADTGRVLLLQRDLHKGDPASGKLEFPGGHIEPGEDSFDAARREWSEEVGLPLPDGNVAGLWTSPNGIYRGHCLVITHEADVPINPDKPKVVNPDNPKYSETAVWMDPRHIEGNPAVRDEVSATASTWLPVINAAQLSEPDDGTRALDEIDALLDLCGTELLAAVQPD